MNLPGVSIFKRGGNKSRRPWQIAYGFGAGRKVITASTNWDDTYELAKTLSRTVQRQKLGLSDQRESREEVQRRRSITDHLNEYEKALKAQGKKRKHADQMRVYAEESLEGYTLVDNLVSSDIQAKIAKLPVTNKTKNRRMYAVMDFLRWGKSDHRWPQSVVDRVALTRLAESKTKKRRTLSLSDLAKLIDVAENSPAVAGMSGRERALLYRTMLASGLRLGESSRLLVEHLCDDGIHAPAVITKNEKEARIRLPRQLVDQLREHVAGREAEAKVFAIPSNPHRMLKVDLVTAGIPRKTVDGIFDFHGFRHQCATILASTGAPPKAIQSHMRHSSIKLTLDTYGHLFDRDRTRVAEVLGRFVTAPAQRALSQESPFMNEEQWSQRESDPHLLNAIQKSDHLLSLQLNELRDKRNRRVAPKTAQRLLRKLAGRALRAQKRGRR